MSNHSNREATRTIGRWSAVIALTVATLAVGCNGDEARRTFRQASANGFEQALNGLFGGLVDGAAAVYRSGRDEESE